VPAAWFPVVLTLFCGSGAAALIYEVVWMQQLELVLGASTPSMGVLLGTFMGGMCLGSALAPRAARFIRRPLRAYACLEVATGLMAIAMLFAMPLVDRVYAAWGGSGASGLAVREMIAAMCLLPPTFAMGAALPIAALAISPDVRGTAWLGWMYAANTLGAVIGSLAAGFYLLRVHDVVVATGAAALLNFIVAAAAWVVPAYTQLDEQSGSDPRATQVGSDPVNVYIAIAASGFCALAAEVVWTRLLTLLFGATAYTFSIVIAVFLAALGAGSAIGASAVKRVRRFDAALAATQWLAAFAIAWSAYALTVLLPFWKTTSRPDDLRAVLATDIARTLIAVLPAALLWGASFPLALAAANRGNPSRTTGGVYAANTLGAIAGALLVSLLLVGRIGTQHTEWLMIVVSCAGGALAVLKPGRITMPLAVSLLVALVCAVSVPVVPPVLVAYGRHAANWAGHAGDIFYVGEGANASVAVSRTGGGVLNYHNAGKVQASSEPQDMRLQRMLGHLTTLVPAAPKSVLVIGCGAGVTAGAVSLDPRVERLTIAEIEPLVPRAAAEYFGSANWNVIRNPKVHVHIDDARHFLLTTKETFDAITSDPLDPWVKGAAMLYTSEFFELAKAHLNPGGVMTVFVQLYESSPDTVRSEAATFFGAFPYGTVWGNTFDGATADTVLLGQVDGQPYIDVDALERRLVMPEFAQVRRSLGDVGFFSALDLFASYGGRAPDLGEWLRGATINGDRNLRLQYLAGGGFNQHAGAKIYADILRYRTFPEDLFAGSSQNIREAIEGPKE
jgi:spermidine synthase